MSRPAYRPPLGVDDHGPGVVRTLVFSVTLLAAGFLAGVAWAFTTAPVTGTVRRSDPAIRAMVRSTEAMSAGFAEVQRRVRLRIAMVRAQSDEGMTDEALEAAIAAVDPETRRRRLIALASWSSDEGLRDRWMSATETDVLIAHGRPDETAGEPSGSRQLLYWKVEDDRIVGRCTFRITDGRVVNFMHAQERWPRPAPAARVAARPERSAPEPSRTGVQSR